MNPASPWRGPMVDAPQVSFGASGRQAAAFLYSGILATAPVVATPIQFITELGTFQWETELN